MKKTILFLSVLTSMIAGSTAHAAIAIECGQLSADRSSVLKVEYQFSAQDDKFSGPVGKNWFMDFQRKPVAASKNVVAKVIQTESGKVLCVTWTQAQGMTPIGKIFEVKYLYRSENAILTIKSMGGFSGGTTLGTMGCVAMYD